MIASEDTGAGRGFAKDKPKGRIRLAEGEEGVPKFPKLNDYFSFLPPFELRPLKRRWYRASPRLPLVVPSPVICLIVVSWSS